MQKSVKSTDVVFALNPSNFNNDSVDVNLYQVSSKLSFPVKILSKLDENTFAGCGELKPGETRSLPCDVAYNPPYQLYIKPSDDGLELLLTRDIVNINK